MVVFKVIMIILDILLGLCAIEVSEGNDEILGALFISMLLIFNAVIISVGV